MIYDIKVLKKSAFITIQQCKEAKERLLKENYDIVSFDEYDIVSFDEYDDDFMVFAKGLE